MTEHTEHTEQPENTEQPEPQTYSLSRYPETLAVVRLAAGAEIPLWAESSSVFSITATANETSLVCAGRSVPKKARHHKPFTAFCVDGALELTAVGVLVALLTPLAQAEIPVFTLSTFDTDWILVPTGMADKAEEAWRRSGHTVAPAVPA
ncbi:ACT domain-containing protein [Nocardioides daeguensis]|uniref:ACT domain-containing protein n=1 Tax=Nocardioides daeguensis TaxID=908359 RepID=A0ABP6UVL7_9ACTN|nr:ACT domain-containing protein [Nocardioides daeguensis]MBV6725465.1 ACT domain-containing protein [Nocardioides daeguensis]MCR1771325.1 ACT domain-containing protein [Nocardioides daeguensis]